MFRPLAPGILFLIAVVPASGAVGEADPAEHRRESDDASQKSRTQVQQALRCEARGMSAERLKHLARAILADPTNATARGLMGLVADEGQWRKPEDVADRVKQDAELASNLAEYNRLRDEAGETEKDQWELALWCERHGLQPEALAHFSTVSRLNPKHPDVWKKLGYRKQKDGQWAPEEEVASAIAYAEARKKADIHWLPLLKKWKSGLARADKQEAAEDHLRGVTDPLALHAIWRTFVTERWADQEEAVRLIGQLKSPAASEGLAFLALSSPSDEVREAATEALRRRDTREFLGMVVGVIRKPLKYEVRTLRGKQTAEVLFVEGERYNLRRTFALPSSLQRMKLIWENFDNLIASNADYAFMPRAGRGGDIMASLSVQAREVERESKVLTAQWLKQSIAEVEVTNVSIEMTNIRALTLLSAVTNRTLGSDPGAWQDWWTEQQGYAVSPPSYSPKPTYNQVVPVAQYVSVPFVLVAHCACFGAGTLVRTLDGPRPIESIRAGDRVLSQETSTGSLRFEPVVAIFHNPPAPTLRVALEGQSPVIVTGIHRFWGAGKGWVMARELKAGDRVRTLGGVSAVESVAPDRVQPVFNLEVHGQHDYFVGSAGALVHDNSLVKPVAAPFDAPTPLPSTSQATH